MTEYINRDAAIALAKDIIVPTKNGYAYRHRCIDPQDLAELPAADVVERKTGKWLKSAWSIRCSECGYDMPFAVRNFCPNCGAKMEELADV